MITMLRKYLIMTVVAMMTLFTSCDKDEPTPQPPAPPTPPLTQLPKPLPQAEKTVLIYAVASNSLSSYLDSDLAEIKNGASEVDLSKTVCSCIVCRQIISMEDVLPLNSTTS